LAFERLTYGQVAENAPNFDYDRTTGYAALAPVTDVRVGAFRHGTDHQIVDIAGPSFVADGVYSMYIAGAVRSGTPPAALFFCDDTRASATVRADCRFFDGDVIGDPDFVAPTEL